MGKFEHGFGTQLGAVLLWRRVIFVGKFAHGFGTQLGAVLLWRRAPSGSLMLAVWSHQTTAVGDKKRYIFSRHSEGAVGSFCR